MRRLARALAVRPVLAVFALALALRLSMVTFVALTGAFADLGDQATYIELVRARLGGEPRPGTVENPDLWLDAASFLLPIEMLFRLFGSHVVLAQLPVAIAGALTAALTALLVSKLVRSAIAVAAGFIVAIYPSQLLWSSLVMKDAFVWMALVVLAALCWWWEQEPSLQRHVTAAALITGVLIFLSFIRDHTTVVAALALALAAVVTAPSLRSARPYAAVGLYVMVPKILGLGWAGSNILTTDTSTIEYFRDKHTVGSAAIETTASGSGWAYLPRGLRVLLLDPLPHQVDGVTTLQLALLEQLVWLPLLVLAVLGSRRLIRRQLAVWFTFIIMGGTAAMWAMVDGNYVTAFRHRGEFLWAVVVLASLGAEQLLNRPRSSSVRHDRLVTT